MVLLQLAIAFIAIAFIAWIAGWRGVAGFSWDIAKFFIVIFLILFILAILVGAAFQL